MQVGIDVKCMQTNFGGCGLFSFSEIKLAYSPWSSKNLIDRNRLKKFMQVGVNETCMYTDFDGCGLSTFGDTATFKNSQISLSDHGL